MWKRITKSIEFTVEKGVKKEGDKLHLKRKDCGNLFNRWTDKERHLKYINKVNLSKSFLKLYECYCQNVKFELDLSSYAPKVDLKGKSSADTSNLSENQI